tara:strand:- start:1930 stop:2649 length:720 start_codon:yes stop_codon:yes gene_type:complete
MSEEEETESGFSKLINALIKAQMEIDHATRDAQSVHHKYATLESVISAVKPSLNKYGIYVSQETAVSDNGVMVQTIFRGHGANLDTGWVEIPVTKNDAHAYGSAMTYARRYSMTTACCLGSADDDGHEAKDNPPAKKTVTKKSTKKPAIKDELKEQGLTNDGLDIDSDDYGSDPLMFKRVSQATLEKCSAAKTMKELEVYWRDAVMSLKKVRPQIDDEDWQEWIEKLTVFRNEMLDKEK